MQCLNRLVQDGEINSELYNKIKEAIEIQEDSRIEVIDFLNELPMRLRIKTSLFVF